MSNESQSPRPARRGRPFQKGQSGNPMGRPKGSRNKANSIAQGVFGKARALAEKVVDLALEGNLVCLRICVERLVAPKKDAPLGFNLPEIGAVANIPKLFTAMTAKLGEGEITPSEIRTLTDFAEVFRKVLETVEIEQRVEALEQNSKK
ncbi:conserved hypothetical protein [Syntrophobacter sp. SbD1]|nr:conserved hypothetical protein [Syntrophobacter sp. SbD1]